MELREWTVVYVKHKDLFARKLQSVEEKEGKTIFHFKDHQLHAYAFEELRLPTASSGKTLVVTLNTKENVSYLISHFKEFAKAEHLMVVFANPKLNEKWVIVPHTHGQIADGDITLGIKSMADSVTYV